LRATIGTLRTTLEAAKADGAQDLASAETAFAQERTTLQNQIQSLRVALEERS